MMRVRLLLIGALVKLTCGSNILFTSDIPSPSHQIWNYELAAELVAKGHNVTMFGASPSKGQGQTNYHTINIEDLVETVHSDLNPEEFMDLDIYTSVFYFYQYTLFNCNYTLHSKGLQTLMNYPKTFKFDLIIFDITCSYCLLPLIQRFNYPPTAAVTAFLLPSYLSDMFGNDIQPAYLPFYLTKYDGAPTFFQRLQNHFWVRMDLLVRKVYVDKTTEVWAKQIFGEKMDSFDSLQDHVSLLLSNLIPGYHHSQPLTPNIIPVGGLHINPAKKLPQDLQNIMDNAKDGVILFSLGTNVKSALLKDHKKKAILDALGQLKQTVLWKFEAELNDVPKNVIIRKWVPQREILAHPNLKVFISHGGALSTIEATHFGVPVVGIPFFADQMMNIQVMIDKKLAVRVDYSTMTSTILLNKIREVLHNPVYSENVKKMSKIIKDQPELPIDRAVFWLEYVIRHNGTHFLDTASRHLPIMVSSSMEIYLFVLFVFVASTVLLMKCVSLMKSKFCGNKVSKKLKKN